MSYVMFHELVKERDFRLTFCLAWSLFPSRTPSVNDQNHLALIHFHCLISFPWVISTDRTTTHTRDLSKLTAPNESKQLFTAHKLGYRWKCDPVYRWYEDAFHVIRSQVVRWDTSPITSAVKCVSCDHLCFHVDGSFSFHQFVSILTNSKLL